MSRAERTFFFLAALVALAAGLGSLAIDRTAVASSQSAENKVATVNVLALMQESLQQAPYLPEREKIADEFTAQIEAAEAQVQRLQQEIQLAGQNAPNAMQLRQQYQAAAQQLQQLGQQANTRFQALSADQAVLAYEQVHKATDKVAAAQGYRLVFASNRDAAIDAGGNLTAVTQEILARPVVYGSNTDDITELVRTELGLPDPAEVEDADAVSPVESLMPDGDG